jgi:NNP family nitrate/nitrite transporter-like MFS transporter
MSGIIGAAGGIGGFYLPVIMGMAKESTGSYQMGFATFGVISALAFALVVLHRTRWLTWALPAESLVVASPIPAAGARADSGA